MIYFIESYTGTKIAYNKVHNINEQRWKDLYKRSSLRLAYDGEESGELYEMYMDFVDLMEFYK